MPRNRCIFCPVNECNIPKMSTAFNNLETTFVVFMLIRLYTQKFKLKAVTANTYYLLTLTALKWIYFFSSEGEDWE